MDEALRLGSLEENITKQQRLLQYLTTRSDPEAAQQAEDVRKRISDMEQEAASLRAKGGTATVMSNGNLAQAETSLKPAWSAPLASPEQRIATLRTSLDRFIRPLLASISEKRRAALEEAVTAFEARISTAELTEQAVATFEEEARELRKKINVMRALDLQARTMIEQIRTRHEELQDKLPPAGTNKSIDAGMKMLNADVERLMRDLENATTEQALTHLAPRAGNCDGRIATALEALSTPPAPESSDEQEERKAMNRPMKIYVAAAITYLVVLTALWLVLPENNRGIFYAAIPLLAVLVFALVPFLRRRA